MKKVTSIRLEEELVDGIKKQYGSVSKFVRLWLTPTPSTNEQLTSSLKLEFNVKLKFRNKALTPVPFTGTNQSIINVGVIVVKFHTADLLTS